MLIYLIKKALPWISIEDLIIGKSEKFRKIRDVKLTILPENYVQDILENFAKILNNQLY